MAEVVPFVAPAVIPAPAPPVPAPKPAPLGGLAVGALALSTGGSLIAGLFKTQRAIGTVIPGVVIEESGQDELEITKHPVETGAAITDHAFLHPAEVIMRCGWTDSDLNFPGTARRAYDQLRALQAGRVPFQVTTGKRTYPNMLVQSIRQTTDQTSENALMATVVLRQVLLVQTRTTTVAPREQQAQPQNTQPPQPTGQQQPAPAPAPPQGSLLQRIVGGGARFLGVGG